MEPERKARAQIDSQLESAGWIVQNYKDLNLSAGLGIAIRELLSNKNSIGLKFS